MTAGIEFDPAERDAIAAEVNISVLKRSDTAIKCVLKSANHVCLYHLEDDHQWRRLDVEGSLFVVERHLNHPNNPNRHMHRIVIINRKSLNNYTDDIIVGNKHLELADQMIMYSNSKQAIIGIWFYEKAQAHQIFDLLQRITNGDNPQSTSDQSRPNRTPKRPAKPTDPAPNNPNSRSDTISQSKPDNSLERFFPNLKLTNGVAGHQVPQNAKDSMFESQAVSTMGTSPKAQTTPTAFKPTAEIDAAIITASEVGIPEGAIGSSTTTDAKVLASQAMQVVKGNPRTESKRKTTARPRSSPKPMPTHSSSYRSNSHSPVKVNGVPKTISPQRSKPVSRQPPSARANSSMKASTFPKNNPMVRQQKQPPKPSPPPKRLPAGKRVQSVKGSNVNRQHVVERPTATSIRTQIMSRSGSESNDAPSNATRAPQIQLLTKPKSAVEAKPVTKGENSPQRSAASDKVQAPPKLAVPAVSSTRTASKFNSNDVKPRGPASASSSDALPSTPNVPISVEVPGAPRAKQVEKLVGERQNTPPTSSPVGGNVGNVGKGGTGPLNMAQPLSEEEAMRQMRNMTMRQAQGNMKMPEAQMFAMQAPFPFVSGDLGLGQASAMMGGGLSGPGGGPSGFAPSLHPQMALMMQQQHQLFMQQQLMAQHHQRQMQLQAGHAAQTMGEPMGNGIGSDVPRSASQSGSAKTKEESANDLMRMLNVERSDGKSSMQKIDEKKNAEGVGASIAKAEKSGELGTSEDKLDKVSFRAVVQRMLTDRKLFDGVYEHYLHYDGN